MEAPPAATPKRKPGRPTRYDFGDKYDICKKLYVDEGKTTPQIIAYFAEHFKVDPSEIPCRRSFHRQFQQWGFPKEENKKLSDEEEAAVIGRMTELWNMNVFQKDIKTTLADEGWELKTYEFNKLWRNAGLRLRNETGYKAPNLESKKRKRSSAEPEEDAPGEDLEDAEDTVAGALARLQQAAPEYQAQEQAVATAMDNEQVAQRHQRLQEIQLDSDQKMLTRKRRRRIRGYGHLPPDAPGTAPRYASETSLDECKAYLNLTNEMYNAVRSDFETLCQEQNIVKKTLCGDGVWEATKQRLIRESAHLSAVMHPPQPDQEKKNIALDCMCVDVTKRMRVKDRAITIAEANNTLDLNPMESKAIRRSFYEILASEKFESKLVSGDEHWQHIKNRWHETSEKLQNIINEGDKKKLKCLDLLCSDAMKRFREDKNKRGERPVIQKNARYGPGPGPAWAATAPRTKRTGPEKAAASSSDVQTPEMQQPDVQQPLELELQAPPPAPMHMDSQGYPSHQPSRLGPSTVLAGADIHYGIDPALTASDAQTTAYFKLAPVSKVTPHPKMWLGKLAFPTVESLHSAATSRHGNSRLVKTHGVVKNNTGHEDSWLIETDEELQVYLGEAGEKATFVVLLESVTL